MTSNVYSFRTQAPFGVAYVGIAADTRPDARGILADLIAAADPRLHVPGCDWPTWEDEPGESEKLVEPREPGLCFRSWLELPNPKVA